jgi:hypothetical protein
MDSYFSAELEGTVYHILEPEIYSQNPLYGRNAMELTAECPTELLERIIRVPMGLGNVTARRANRMTIVACNAALEYDLRVNTIEAAKLSEQIQERIIKTAVKLLKKDLPMRPKSVIDLYVSTVRAIAII